MAEGGAFVLLITEHPEYLHARVTGPRTPENALRFFVEVHAACVQRGQFNVLMEMDLAGPSLDPVSIFRVITERSPAGARLRRIAYVEVSEDPARARLAETIAVNRGVNVRLFADRAAARAWLLEP